MVPLEPGARRRPTTAPQVIRHYNLFRSAEINGAAGAGRVSSGQALEAMEELARRSAAAGHGLSSGRA